MAKYSYDMGIIGGGAAGLTVAAGAARLGAKALLVEKENVLGGDCLHYGCVPSKTLINIAKACHRMRNSARLGLPPVNLPPINYGAVVDKIRNVISTIQRYDSEERFCSLGVKVVYGLPRFVDEHSIEINGSMISARKWVIATGSSPAIPSLEGLGETSVLTNREIFYLQRLPESLIILGAGPVATEMAQAFCRLGTRVTVIQRSGQILSKEDKDMADEVMNILALEGVAFHLNASVIRVGVSGDKKEITIQERHGEQKTLRADAILVAMGRSPNLEGLGLSEIGVDTDRKGIKVDERLRTTQKHIYAAGDVTGLFQFTHAAGYEGGVVISNAIFRFPKKVDYSWLPWCTYSDPELASIGMNEKRAKASGINCSVWTERFEDNDRAVCEGQRRGKIKMVLDERERVIGVQILGPRAGELINEWVIALNGKVKLSKIAMAVHPYPTLGEINKRVAGAYMSPKIFSPTVKKGLKFFFHLKGRACG